MHSELQDSWINKQSVYRQRERDFQIFTYLLAIQEEILIAFKSDPIRGSAVDTIEL